MTVALKTWRSASCAALVTLGLCGCLLSPEQKEAKFLLLGKQNYAKKDYARAIIEFKNATRFAPKDAEAYYQLGLAYAGNRELPRLRAQGRHPSVVSPCAPRPRGVPHAREQTGSALALRVRRIPQERGAHRPGPRGDLVGGDGVDDLDLVWRHHPMMAFAPAARVVGARRRWPCRRHRQQPALLGLRPGHHELPRLERLVSVSGRRPPTSWRGPSHSRGSPGSARTPGVVPAPAQAG